MLKWLRAVWFVSRWKKPVPKTATKALVVELKKYSKKKLIKMIIALYNEMQVLKTLNKRKVA